MEDGSAGIHAARYNYREPEASQGSAELPGARLRARPLILFAPAARPLRARNAPVLPAAEPTASQMEVGRETSAGSGTAGKALLSLPLRARAP